MNRTLLILAGALIVGGIAVFFVYQDAYVQEATGGARVMVVAAARDIPFGEPIQASWLTVEELPLGYVEERHLRAAELRQLIGVTLAQSVRAGEVLMRTDLSSLSDRQRTLSGEIPPGKRAITIDARPESSHAGLLRPGDRVDVVLTVGDIRDPGSGRAVVVAQNLLVLSVGRSIEWEGSDDPSARRSGYTSQVNLEVDLADAQRLTLARRQGDLRLVLRNPNDVSVLPEPPELREQNLLDREHRAGWLRRFALVERTPNE